MTPCEQTRTHAIVVDCDLYTEEKCTVMFFNCGLSNAKISALIKLVMKNVKPSVFAHKNISVEL